MRTPLNHDTLCGPEGVRNRNVPPYYVHVHVHVAPYHSVVIHVKALQRVMAIKLFHCTMLICLCLVNMPERTPLIPKTCVCRHF